MNVCMIKPMLHQTPTFPQGKVRDYDDDLPIPSIILADFPLNTTCCGRQTHLQNKADGMVTIPKVRFSRKEIR